MLKSIFLTWTLIACVYSEKFRFNNYTLYKIFPENEQHRDLLRHIQHTDVRYDFWTNPSKLMDFVSVMSSPNDKAELENVLNAQNMKFTMAIPNIQEHIDKEEKVVKYSRSTSMRWDVYYTLDDIYTWMDDMATAYPNVATSIVGGRSLENRPIRGLRISHGPGRKAIFIESGSHGREWIVMPGACYLINELLTSTDEWTRAAARDYDWYIFPVTNPDGYVWTHERFRMWRKNRRPVGDHFGVDLNRNWNNNWLGIGSSANPASDIYAGKGPFSEPETRTLSAYVVSLGDRIDLYLSLHSFSQLLLFPFGNTTEQLANYDDHMNIGRRAMGALAVRYGTQYVTGNTAEAIYFATGISTDWVKGHLNVPLVYCYEFRDRGQYGFLLPENQILPNNQEFMDSVLEFIHQAKRFGYMIPSWN